METNLRALWPGLTLLIFASLGTLLCTLTVPICLIMIYQWAIPARSTTTLLSIAIIGTIAVTSLVCMEVVRRRIMQRLGGWLGAWLGLTALETSVSNVLYGGKVSAQVLRDVSDVRSFVSGGALASAIELVWVPLLVVLLFVLHPILSFIAIGGITMSLLLAVLKDRMVRTGAMQASDFAIENTNEINGLLANAEVVHALGLSDRVARRWAHGYITYEKMAARPAKWDRLITAASRFVQSVTIIAVIGGGAMLLITGEMTTGRVFGSMLIIRHTLGPCSRIVSGWRDWVMALGAYKRVKTAFSEAQSRRSNKPLTRPRGNLEVDRLVFVPPGIDRAVLRGVSFTVEPGEVLGVVGPSGAGKSTLARMLVGLWRPSSGGVYLDGQSVFLWERTSFGEHIGYLPQNPGLFDGSIRENIARLADGSDAEVLAAAKQTGAHDVISRLEFGYSTEIGDATFLLSGGQRQRVALARAFFRSPHMLVLDEPDAHLDEPSRAILRKAILDAKEAGAIVIIISHHLATIRSVADKVLALRNGVVERFGSKQAVLLALQGRKEPAAPLRALAGADQRESP